MNIIIIKALKKIKVIHISYSHRILFTNVLDNDCVSEKSLKEFTNLNLDLWVSVINKYGAPEMVKSPNIGMHKLNSREHSIKNKPYEQK